MIEISKPILGEEEKRAVLQVLDSGNISQGSVVKKFEKKIGSYIGVKNTIATNSGTSALHTALLAMGIGKGDEVITSPFTFIASANSILYCGAKPVFADIYPSTFNIAPDSIKEKITSKTKAILVVHLYGLPCDMDPISDVANEFGLHVIEDACQAHGAEYNGKKVGSFGDCGIFSFYPTKNMTTGEGGMITTNNVELAEKARSIREHGTKKRYYYDVLGYNYRMNDIAAAIGIEQLKKLDEMNGQRIKNAALLSEGIEKIKGLIPPYTSPNSKHVFHQYTIKVTETYPVSRDSLVNALHQNGVGTGIYYPLPIHKQNLYLNMGYNDKLPNAERASKQVLSLPVHPSISEIEITKILKELQN